MIRFFRYKLPFRSPFVTSAGTFKNREGIILTAELPGGEHFAFGEAAPLPGFSAENLNETARILSSEKKNIEHALASGNTPDYIRSIEKKYASPSLSFGLDTLFEDYRAKQAGEPFLGSAPDSVACNAILGIRDAARTLEQAKQHAAQGFNTLKLKVGLNPDRELETVQEIRRLLPDVKLRLDANQIWEPAEAIRFLRRFELFDIEYCEQPVHKNDFEGLAQVRQNTEIKIAADESAENYADVVKLIGLNAVDIIIMKPMLTGSFAKINVTKGFADSHGIEVVFTTSLEHIIGRRTTAVLAALFGSKKYAHGLATNSLFVQQNQSQEILSGRYTVDKAAGLGTDINIKDFAEFE